MKSSKSLWLISVMVPAIILSACNLGATAVPTQDPGAVQTEAFNLVMTQAAMQSTQTAMAIPPTVAPTNTLLPLATPQGLIPTAALAGLNTPIPLNTLLPGLTPLASPVPTLGSVATITTQNGCNDGLYIGETAPLDGAKLKNFKEIEKAWTILNTGTCPWDEGYAFVFNKELSSPELKGYDIVLKKAGDFTEPGHSQSFVIKLTVPGGKTKEVDYVGYWKLRDDAGNYFGPLVSIKFTAVP
jgi:hypothetical protein